MMNKRENHPLISIIVPIYNVQDYLCKCIDSLLAQEYDNYEIILVNDCSTDNSKQIAEKYAKTHQEKCLLVNHDVNGGLAAARNTGMKSAKGEWLTFVDSDDWVSKDYLSGLYKIAIEESADVVIGGVVYYYNNGNTRSADSFGKLKKGASNKNIIAQCRSYACGRLFKRKLFIDNNIVFPTDIRRSEDIGTIIPILTRAKKISIYEKDVYFYFQRSTSLSLSNNNIEDLSFYPKTVNRMLELSVGGYEKELEFRCIHELLYGMVYLMVESKKSRKEFMEHIESFNNDHRGWEYNPYIVTLPKAKQVFIKLSGNRKYTTLKLLVFIKRVINRG
jgi:Glycosyltransferases involved in cell wall biogenesis